jgi:hypothetical protein
MNARTNAILLERTCYPCSGSPLWRPVSPQLAAAVCALLAPNPDLAEATLEEVREALEGTGLRWSSRGEITYAPRVALIDEIERLIHLVGGGANAADLFPFMEGLGAMGQARRELKAISLLAHAHCPDQAVLTP